MRGAPRLPLRRVPGHDRGRPARARPAGCGSRRRRTCSIRTELGLLLRGRRRRLGRGVAADAGPRQPGAAVAAARRAGRADRGGRVRAAAERLTVHPEYVQRGEPWLDPRVLAARARAGRPGDRAGAGRQPAGRAALAGAGRRLGWWRPAGSTCTSRSTPRAAPRPAHRLRRRVRRLGRAARATVSARSVGRCRGAGPAATPEVRAALARAERDPAGLSDAEALALFDADGPALDALARWPTQLRRDDGRRRRDLRGQPEHQLHQRLLHRLPVLRVRPAAHRRRRLHAVAETGRRPRRRGVGGSAPPRSACRAASTRTCPAPRTSTSSARSRTRVPDMHVHAFSPMEVVNGAARTGLSIARLAGRGQGGRAGLASPAPRRRSSTTTSAGC